MSVTLLGIEAATFRLAVQCLNHLRHRVPAKMWSFKLNAFQAVRVQALTECRKVVLLLDTRWP